MASFEVVQISLPYYMPMSTPDEAATEKQLCCKLEFEHKRRIHCCKTKTEVTEISLDQIQDVPQARWRKYSDTGVQIALFSVDMRHGKRKKARSAVETIRCTATVTRLILKDAMESVCLADEAWEPDQIWVVSGKITTGKAGTVQLAGIEKTDVVELTFRAPQPRLFKLETCTPRMRTRDVLELWIRRKVGENQDPVRTSVAKFRKMLSRGLSGNFGTESWRPARLSNLSSSITMASKRRLFGSRGSSGAEPEKQEKDTKAFRPDFDEWKPKGFTDWKKLWDGNLDCKKGDKLLEGFTVTDVMENEFRRDIILLYNTLFPQAALVKLFALPTLNAFDGILDDFSQLSSEYDPEDVIDRRSTYPDRRTTRRSTESVRTAVTKLTSIDTDRSEEHKEVAEDQPRDSAIEGLAISSKASNLSRPSTNLRESNHATFSPSTDYAHVPSFLSKSQGKSRGTASQTPSERLWRSYISQKSLKSIVSRRSIDITNRKIIQTYSDSISFLKRLFICLALCGVHFVEDDNLQVLGQEWPFPLASLLGHGGRILFRVEDVDVYNFLNFLLKGDEEAHDWKQSIPPPFLKRLAATHGVDVVEGCIFERKLKATNLNDVANNVADGFQGKHLGLDLPLGGLGNISPVWKLGEKSHAHIGFRGEAILSDTNMPKAGIQGGHLYLRVDELGLYAGGAGWHDEESLVDDIRNIMCLHEKRPPPPRRTPRICSCPPKFVKEAVEMNEEERDWLWNFHHNRATQSPPPSTKALERLLERFKIQVGSRPNAKSSEIEDLLEELQDYKSAIALQQDFSLKRVVKRVCLEISYRGCLLCSTGWKREKGATVPDVSLLSNYVRPDGQDTEIKAVLRVLKEMMPKLHKLLPKENLMDQLKKDDNWWDEELTQDSFTFPGLQTTMRIRTFRLQVKDCKWLLNSMLRCDLCTTTGKLEGMRFETVGEQEDGEITFFWTWHSDKGTIDKIRRKRKITQQVKIMGNVKHAAASQLKKSESMLRSSGVQSSTVAAMFAAESLTSAGLRSNLELSGEASGSFGLWSPKQSGSPQQPRTWSPFVVDHIGSDSRQVPKLGPRNRGQIRSSQSLASLGTERSIKEEGRHPSVRDSRSPYFDRQSLKSSASDFRALRSAGSSSALPQARSALSEIRQKSTRRRGMITCTDSKKVSTVLIGLESTAPHKKSPLGQEHDALGTSNMTSALNNWKWCYYRKYNACQIPADLGAMRVNITKHSYTTLKEVIKALDLCDPARVLSRHSSRQRSREEVNTEAVEQELFQTILSATGKDARSAVLEQFQHGRSRGQNLRHQAFGRLGLDEATRKSAATSSRSSHLRRVPPLVAEEMEMNCGMSPPGMSPRSEAEELPVPPQARVEDPVHHPMNGRENLDKPLHVHNLIKAPTVKEETVDVEVEQLLDSEKLAVALEGVDLDQFFVGSKGGTHSMHEDASPDLQSCCACRKLGIDLAMPMDSVPSGGTTFGCNARCHDN